VTAVADVTLNVAPTRTTRRLETLVAQYGADGACALAVGWWLIAVTRAWAGREPGATTVGALLVLLAVLVVRPTRYVPAWATSLVATLSLGAFAVAILAPTGWAGAPVAASYVSAGWLALCCAATVRRNPQSLQRLSLLVVAGALVEVAEAWLPWWGGEDPTTPMIGTFYWHNPFAAFLLPGAAIGLWTVIRERGPVAFAGGLGFALATIGVFYSTSRASIACLFGVIALVVAGTVATMRSWRSVRRGIGGLIAAGVAVYLIAGPPFFPHRSSAIAAMHARTAGQSLGHNAGYRWQFWQEAINLFQRHPWTGGGYHSLATESAGHVPQGWALSPYAHNGYLQALASGGLLLAVPFLALMALAAYLVVTELVRAVRVRDINTPAWPLAVAVAAVMIHAAVDFDWSYSANRAQFAVLVGLLAGWRFSRRRSHSAPKGFAVVAAAFAVAALCLCAWVTRSGDLQENLPVAGQASVQAHAGTGR
jgi:O-antigen ligase